MLDQSRRVLALATGMITVVACCTYIVWSLATDHAYRNDPSCQAGFAGPVNTIAGDCSIADATVIGTRLGISRSRHEYLVLAIAGSAKPQQFETTRDPSKILYDHVYHRPEHVPVLVQLYRGKPVEVSSIYGIGRSTAQPDARLTYAGLWVQAAIFLLGIILAALAARMWLNRTMTLR